MVNPDSDGMDLKPPTIPGFELLEPIGEGGMGTVFRALQISLQRTVAVKLLKSIQGPHPVTDFQRESLLMASVSHPNLVTIFDCGQVQDHYYIVTEFIRGSTLRRLMTAGQPWPTARVCLLLDRIGRALTHIHGEGILHLDLKPENVLCDEHGEPKITDFGLASVEVDAQTLTEAEIARGTPDYCAPEQRFGFPTNERSDLFSFAVLAYELLTGHLPGRVYQSACKLNPRLPAKVDGILKRGLARSPEDRYPTVDEFRRDLLGALQSKAAWGRRIVQCAAVALCLVLVVVLTGDLRKPNSPSQSSPQLANMQAWIVHEHPEQLTWFDTEQTVIGGVEPQPMLIHGRKPSGAGAPPLPIWPATQPVLVISSPNALGFVHPLFDRTLGRRVIGDWRRLLEMPPTLAADNFCRAGSFDGDCLIDDHGDNFRPWRFIDPAMLHNGDALQIADPPDRPGNPALMLHRKDLLDPGREFGCYQWLSRSPERAGATVVMRYRARAEEGDGRLCIRIQLPLLLPLDSRDERVERLRGVSVPFAELAHKPHQEPRQYKLEDWVTPGREWQTYYVIWEWPPYCQDPGLRNLVVFYSGIGKVWLDDVELSIFEPNGAP